MLRVFVSSTTDDLKNHRSAIVERLRLMGIDVIDMTSITAEPESPHQVCSRYVAQCDILIVIVAFRRGTIVAEDDQQRSITQMEVSAAVESQKCVLAYVLKDTPENRRDWPEKFNELDVDPALVVWRKWLGKRFTPVEFQADEIPDVLPAVHRYLMEETNRRRRRSAWRRNSLLALVAVVIVLWFNSAGFRSYLMSVLHRSHDPVVFSGLRNGNYKTVRLLEGRADILDNTSFEKDLGSTVTTFDMFANTFGSFREYERVYDALATRGVRLRFIVSDFSMLAETNPNWMEFQRAVEPGPFQAAETVAKGMNAIQGIRILQAKHPKGRIEYRLNRLPILYTLWIRDPSESTGMAHLGLHYYGTTSQSPWPAIRVSRLTAGNQLRSLSEQFEYLWERSVQDVLSDAKQ